MFLTLVIHSKYCNPTDAPSGREAF